MSLAQINRDKITICYDNFDYSEDVRHQTLRDPAKHVSATTGKLCIGHYMPPGGLRSSMLHPRVPLDPCDILQAAGNEDDTILHACQRHWIAEAIRYTHRTAVEKLFSDDSTATEEPGNLPDWPELPTIERLSPRKTPHYALSPILENEGTIAGTYNVIDAIFTGQLKYDCEKDFDGTLIPVYGDQKTFSLLRTIQKERQEAALQYDRFNWFLPVPGLFHWRTNYMDMIHETYSGPEYAAVESTLHHNKNHLGCVQGHKSPFHHKEEVTTRAFDARATALFYRLLPPSVRLSDAEQIDTYIGSLSRSSFLHKIEEKRQYAFTVAEQSPMLPEPIDDEFSAHAKFLQQMETYKTLKHAIKHADIGLIKRVIARCCLLFHGSGHPKYAFLSFYMTWLTQTAAADGSLQLAVLANGLVNLRGAEDSWFEIDRLNEFFNLQMKTLMATRRTSTIDCAELFRRTALTGSYCTSLKIAIEATFGEYSNGRHQAKDASREVRHLAYQIAKSKSITKNPLGRKSPFQPEDILQHGVKRLDAGVQRFNLQVIEGELGDEDEDGQMTSTPIAALNNTVTIDSDIDD